MSRRFRRGSSWLLACLLAWPLASSAGPAVDDQARAERRPVPAADQAARLDLTKDPTLYVVGYAHLDTHGRWDYITTIQEYLPDCFGFPASLPSILAVTAANEGPPVRPVQRLGDTPGQ